MHHQDLRDPEFLKDPAPFLEKMRAKGPLAKTRIPLLGDLLLTTTDEAARLLLKDSRFSRDPAAAGGKPFQSKLWWLPHFMRPFLNTMLVKDGDDHARIRSLVDRAFSRRSIEDMRPRLEVIADGLLNNLPTGAPVDIVKGYAAPLPLMAICELLGLPEEDREKVSGWISPISRPTGLMRILVSAPGLYRITRYFRGLFDEVRKNPDKAPAGLIRELVLVESEGDQLNEDELLALVFTLFVAGHVTTVHLISDAIVGFVDRPEPPTDITSNPAQLALAVEEFMRFFTPVLMSKPHYAKEDVEFGDVMVKRGEKVSALLLAANYDPGRFDAPENLQPDRRPNPHLGFGHGKHVCLGMQLARVEAQVALSRLFARYPTLRLSGPRDEVKFQDQTGVRGINRLMLEL